MRQRQYQQAIAPVDFPPALRARLDAVRSPVMAENFRREAIFNNYRPKIAEALARDHLAIAGNVCRWYHVPSDIAAAGSRVANSWADARAHTASQHAELQRAHLGRAFDEQQIRDYADNYARICSRMLTLEHRADFAQSMGIEPPAGRNVTRSGACARMDDPQWWRRQLRRTWTRRAENVMREIGIVRKGREPYASDDAVQARASMKARGRKFLETHEAVNEAGEQLNLFKLAEHSMANPALRRGEFMTRVRGFEEIARDAGHVAQFWTLTAPSAFHAQLSTGEKNPNFARAVVREAQAWLCKQWARVRAKLKRLSVLVYGFRIAEPHHDATPHWHLLLFCRPRDSATIEAVIRGYWLSEYAEEKGAREHRAKCISIDESQGSAAGYVAKYVSKNIDGAGAIGECTDEETAGKILDSCRRVDAWASLHGIRQFQQVGGPPVGLWRELRRLTESAADPGIEKPRACADRGDWRAFVYALAYEGIAAGRRVGLRFEREATGELTKYAEEKPAPVVGVRYCSAVEITRPHSWRIQRCGTVASSSDSRGNTTNTSHHETRAEPGTIYFGLPVSGPHWAGGLCGLRLGDHGKPKRKSRGGAAAVVQLPTSSPARGSDSSSLAFSSLGPVAITVRGHSTGVASPEAPRLAACSQPTNSNEIPKVMNPPVSAAPGTEAGNRMGLDDGSGVLAKSGLATRVSAGEGRPPKPGEFFRWEKRLRAFALEHGRYPSAAETIALWSAQDGN